MKSKTVIFAATCLLTCVILVVATIGNSWIAMSTTIDTPNSGAGRSVNVNEGLWNVCVYSDFYNMVSNGCHSIEYATEKRSTNIGGWFYACRAFCVIACIASVIAVLFVLMNFKREMNHTRLVVAVSFVAAAIFVLIAIILYTFEFEAATEFASGETLIPVDTDYGWSYILAWVSLILCGVHSVAVFFVIKNNPYRV